MLVFGDTSAIYEQDWIVDGEEQWRVMGWASAEDLLMVIYVTWDEEDGLEVYRIISAREATSHERRRYEGAT